MNFDSEKLGNDLKVFQMKESLTLYDLRDKTGINVPTLSRIRNGKDNALFIEIAILSDLMKKPLKRYIK